jgi:chemotaxis protein MotB
MSLMLALAIGCVPKKKYDALDAQLAAEQARAADLQKQLADTSDRASDLAGKASALESDVSEMELALAELRSAQAEAEARVAQYRDLVSRFSEMIDAGTLRVKIVEGRMVVELATDILFPSGSAELSKEGLASIAKVGGVLATIPERAFQVEGHTDYVPIKSAKYPSNWELAASRAITVVRTLSTSGLPPERVSAASFAFYKPTAANDTPENKAANRRIEIVILPDLSKLPGFEELNEITASK